MKKYFLLGLIGCGSLGMIPKPPRHMRFAEDKSYLQLLQESVSSASEPLIPDACVAGFGCLMGTCTVCSAFPQVPLSYNITSNSLFACFIFYYCIKNGPEELATTQLCNKIKHDMCKQFIKEKHE